VEGRPVEGRLAAVPVEGRLAAAVLVQGILVYPVEGK